MYIYMCPTLSISVHNDIEMKGDPDTVSLPIPNCIAKDIFAGAIKEEAERDFRGETPIFGIDPLTSTVTSDQPNDHKPIDEDTNSSGSGRLDDNSVTSECNNNNSSIANNNNNNNNSNNNLMKRKLKDFVDENAEDEFNMVRPPPKRVSPFLNTPKQRKDERKRILRLSVYKLREMEDPENYLRKSVLINNVLRRLHKEIREEKRGYTGFGLGCATAAMGHPYYRPRRFDYDMLNNSHLPTRAAFFFDEPCFPGETEKITDDMTDSLVRSLEASSPPLSPVPTPPPQSTFPITTLTQSPLSLSPLSSSSSSSSSSSTLQIPGTPHLDTSTAATSLLTSPLTTSTDSLMATTAPASSITTIITTTSLPSQMSTTTSTTSSNTEEDMLLGDDGCPSNDVPVDTVSTNVTTSSVGTNNTAVVDVTSLSSSINHDSITSSRTNTNTINDSSNSHNFGTNKPTDINRTAKSESTTDVVIGALGCSPTSDSNNNNSNVCNANGDHVFGTSVPVDHVIAPIASSRTNTLNNNNNNNNNNNSVSSREVTSTNSSVLFSTTNFGSSGFLSVSGSTPYSVGSLVSSTTTTSSANTVPSLTFQEKQISVEMDTMFNNLIRVLGET